MSTCKADMLSHLLPRHMAIFILVSVACLFASNHVAARLAFDDGTGLLLALLARSGLALIVLASIVAVQGEEISLRRESRSWQLLLGGLIAVQGLCLYSAVARIPVVVALLLTNTFPILLTLLTWALGGRRPTLKASLLMGMILVGLVLVLDVPEWLGSPGAMGPQWLPGVALGLGSATAFACALWVTEHRLSDLRGSVRSLLTMGVVFIAMVLAGISGLIPGGLALPATGTGWVGLALLATLYGMAFTLLFILVPRLDMTRNAPVMNIEPVASLVLGYLVLGQMLGMVQLIGGAIVLSGVVLLSLPRTP